MKPVNVPGILLKPVLDALAELTAQPLPHTLGKGFRAAKNAVSEHMEPFQAEIGPFVEKHTKDGEVMNPFHKGFPEFYEDAKDLLEREHALDVTPIMESDLDRAAEIMASRAARGLGEEFVYTQEKVDLLRGVGIIQQDPTP